MKTATAGQVRPVEIVANRHRQAAAPVRDLSAGARLARHFHATLPGAAPTPLVELPGLAARLGVRAVLVKDESQRFGLEAFKGLGSSWAVARVLGGCSGLRQKT